MRAITLRNSRAWCSLALRGEGGPKGSDGQNVFFIVCDLEASEGYQMLFTGSKNIDPSPSYRVSKFANYIQLHCGRAF